MPTNIIIKNTNQINQLKISIEVETEVEDLKTKTKKKEWKKTSDKWLKPGESEQVWSAATRRIIIQEMPT